jgi:phage FluMu gp28-like protein
VNKDSRVAVIVKSRRIGISWSEAADATIEAADVDGCDVWYVGYNKDMAAEFIRDCATWAKALGAKHEEVQQDKHTLTYTIRFASGWRITALSDIPERTNINGEATGSTHPRQRRPK